MRRTKLGGVVTQAGDALDGLEGTRQSPVPVLDRREPVIPISRRYPLATLSGARKSWISMPIARRKSSSGAFIGIPLGEQLRSGVVGDTGLPRQRTLEIRREGTLCQPSRSLTTILTPCRFGTCTCERLDSTYSTAADGEVGQAEATLHRPDLIVMDLELPGLSGAQVARKLRAQESTPAHSDDCSRHRLFAARTARGSTDLLGFDDILD